MSHERLKRRLRGVPFTNPTPFTADGDAVRHDALAENVAFLRDAGAEVVVPCGNTGEYYSLSNDERAAVVETVADAFGDAGAVVGGVGGSTKTATTLAARYADAGADAVMVMSPGHTYVHEAGLLEYYEAIVETVELPVVLYKRGPELTHEHLRALSERDAVVAVKYAVDDVAGFTRAVRTTPGDLVWMNGIAERFGPSFALEGAEGLTTGVGNFVPGATLGLQDALAAGDWDRARELRDLLAPLEELRAEAGRGNRFESANNVPVVKYGLELAGYTGGPVREPLVELSDADAERVEEYYEAVRAANP